MANRSRINWIDWAKSTTMFLVVLGHCHIQSSHQLITQVIYSFHIPLFFFLSGLLCPKVFSKSSLLKDCKYIIVPYFVFGIFQIITHSLLSRNFCFSFYYTNVGSLFIGDDASIGAIWFLPALFICKQLYFLFQRIGRGSIITHALLFSFSLFPAYYISSNNINMPLFADSALFGLPFFLLGSKSLTIIEGKVNKNTPILIGVIVLFTLTIILSSLNGVVCIATCSYGNNLLLYYTNAFSGIAAIIGSSLLLRNHCLEFVITTSYGTIVTLGFHGIILLILQYYIPKYSSFYTPSISLPTAIIYSLITYITCYFIIMFGDRYCPQLLGLRGSLSKKLLHLSLKKGNEPIKR